MKQLTNKTYFILYQGYKIWITPEQGRNVIQTIKNGGKFVEIDGRLLPVGMFGILKGEDNEIMEKEKKGEWKCEAGYWHQKNEECGHNILNNYRSFNKSK